MSSSAASKTAAKPAAGASLKPSKSKEDKPRETNRDLIEQIVVAFILALLIKNFEAEAFVIPTGSMAPTLMGRHKEIACPECGVTFQVNASDELEDHGGGRVIAGTCQNCRAPVRLDAAPSFKGDRILVMKFLYDMGILPGGGAPDRYDIVVFKYPEQPEVNYIKRCVGLPNETVRIQLGDLRVRPLDQPDQPFVYPRRPLGHQQAMQMLVWDDNHRPAHLKERPEWQRWQARDSGAWSEGSSSGWGWGPSFSHVSKSAAGDAWNDLRYRNLAPDPTQWQEILQNASTTSPPRATLISDFYAYNSAVMASRGGDGFDWFQPHWVGDLTLSMRVQATEAKGKFRIELVKAGVPYRCTFDLATGQATLSRGEEVLGAPAATGFKDTAKHTISFANVDGRLTLWVDGRTPFGDGHVYDDGSTTPAGPTAADLDPAGVATQGGGPVRVSDLVLKRDIYYTLQPGPSDYSSYDLRRPGDREVRTAADRAAAMYDVLADPSRFEELARPRSHDFPIRPGHYMMMGDNSPRSKDSRGWGQNDRNGYYDPILNTQVEGWASEPRESWEVPEGLLIGKAFFVYWPHGHPFWPNIQLTPDFRVPFRPEFERMKWIR